MVIKAPSAVVSRADYLKVHGERVLETFQLDPVVTITLKGKPYTLEYNNWAVKNILRAGGPNIISAGFRHESMEDPEVMGLMLFWGLQTHHPELTLDETDKMFTFRHYPYILNRLTEAIDLFLPDMSDYTVEKPKGEQADPGDPTSPPIQAG